MIRTRLADARGFAHDRGGRRRRPPGHRRPRGAGGLDTAQRSSGREKARSVAAALTEQDQERLRSFRAVDLANYDDTRDVTVNKVTYTVDVAGRLGPRLDRRHRELQQQRDPGRLHADHLDDDVAASSTRRSRRSRCRASSLRPIGAFGTNQGTLGIQVNDRDGAGVEGIPVTIAGPDDPDQPDELGRLRDLRLRADRVLHGQLNKRRLGRQAAATRTPTVGATVSQRHRQRQDDRSTTRRPASTSASTPSGSTAARCHRGAESHAALGRRTPACPPARSRPSPGRASRSPPAAAAHDRRDRPLPVHRRLRPLRRRLPRRRPDDNDADYYYDLYPAGP